MIYQATPKNRAPLKAWRDQTRVLGFLWLLGMGVCGCNKPEVQSDSFPNRPIKLVVPFAAGGGSDTFGRIIQGAIDDQGLLDQPLVIINVPGAGGTIGSRRVKNARPDGYTLLLLHEGIMTAKYAGNAVYGPEAFTPIAGTGNTPQVIAVSESSPFADLNALMETVADKPDSVVFSANIGAPSHFAGLMLESEKTNARFRYTQNGGGAKRFAALQGGHVDVSAFSISEYLQFRSSGIRALALLSPDRHNDLTDLPTAREQGIDVISENMQFWWAPPGTPQDRVETIARVLQQAMATSSVQAKLAEMKVDSVTMTGALLDEEISRRNQRISSAAPSTDFALPNFPIVVLCGTLILGVIAAMRSTNRSAKNDGGESGTGGRSGDRRTLAITVVLTVLYVVGLHWNWVAFVPATACYCLLLGGLLAIPPLRKQRVSIRSVAVVLVVVSLLMSVVLHQLFTKVLVVDLP